ncbi:L,D-transpeptidase family protein [Lachnospiraceae bacterium 29-84]
MKKAKKQQETPKKRLSRKSPWIWAAAAGAILSLVVAYLGVAAYFRDRFLFGTFINGVEVCKEEVKSVEKLISAEIEDYQIKIVPKDGEEELIDGKDMGLAPVFDGTLQKKLKEQNTFLWPMSFFSKQKIEVRAMVSYDKDSLKQAAKELDVLDEKRMKEPEDAKISDYTEDAGYQIIPEEDGTVVDEEKFFEALEDAVLGLEGSMSMEEAGCYTEPELTQESKKLKKQRDSMNKIAGASITYEFGDKQEVLDGKTISQWIEVSGKRKVSVSDAKIQEYVANLAESYNTAGRAKSLASSYGTEVTVEGGDYGWKIDQEQEVAALKEHIVNGETVTKEPAYSQRANSREGNDYGNTYVEVNLSDQHLFYYKDGNLIVDSDFVSGNVAKGWSTPAGAFGLYYKERDKTLRGEDYATPVSFWMPFNGGIGFHDATWRNAFGGNYYKRNGSHGCVNLPFQVAQTLFDNIEAGCPVLVYQDSGASDVAKEQEEERKRQEEQSQAQAQAEASAVVQLIDSLGEITLESRTAIVNARNQFEALSSMARGYVANYGVLEAAEARLGQLEAESAADQQAVAQAQPVIDAINQLAGVEVTLDMKGMVESIRAQYSQLSEAARGKVTNYGILEAAEQKISELERAQEGADG